MTPSEPRFAKLQSAYVAITVALCEIAPSAISSLSRPYATNCSTRSAQKRVREDSQRGGLGPLALMCHVALASLAAILVPSSWPTAVQSEGGTPMRKATGHAGVSNQGRNESRGGSRGMQGASPRGLSPTAWIPGQPTHPSSRVKERLVRPTSEPR